MRIKFTILAFALILSGILLISCVELDTGGDGSSTAPSSEGEPSVTESFVSFDGLSADISSEPVTSEFEASEETSIEESSENESGSGDESGEEPSHESAEESFGDESGTSTYGAFLKPYIEIIESGSYVLKTTEPKTIGGESVPYTTLTYFNGGLIYVFEQETHSSSSELLITAEGVYHFDDAEKTVYLMPVNGVSARTLYGGNISFEESGECVIADTEYTYERYIDSNGSICDFLFAGGELKRMKVYNEGDDYTLITVSISSDISAGRFEVPADYQVKDYR